MPRLLRVPEAAGCLARLRGRVPQAVQGLLQISFALLGRLLLRIQATALAGCWLRRRVSAKGLVFTGL